VPTLAYKMWRDSRGLAEIGLLRRRNIGCQGAHHEEGVLGHVGQSRRGKVCQSEPWAGALRLRFSPSQGARQAHA